MEESVVGQKASPEWATRVQEYFEGERSLFASRNLSLQYCTFGDGESPLKESRGLKLDNCLFRWKYPLWYCRDVEMKDCRLFEMARSGIWYTHNLSAKDCTIEAPKTFRRATGLDLERVTMPCAQETMWNCSGIRMKKVTAKGDYLAMNSQDIEVEDFDLLGNYAFDGCRNVVVRRARMLSKDAFWNCENVEVHDSFVYGEYLGWNSKNVTFENCVIESLQGLCYMDNVVLKNCRLLNTNLSFEYSTVEAEIQGKIDSVLNPSGGIIVAQSIVEVLMDPSRIDVSKTKIVTEVSDAV